MHPSAQRSTLTIADILGIGENDVRVQNPSVFATKGRNPQWFIRPWVEKIAADGVKPVQERIYLGSCDGMTKRQAVAKKNEVMATINRRQYVLQAQVNFGDFLDHYEREYVNRRDNLAASTQAKYAVHLKNHIRPAFAHLALAQIDTRAIDGFLAAKSHLSWSTRMDLRNLLCGIFTQAERWGIWKERNPALFATVGRERKVREPKKLTEEQTRAFLAELPDDLKWMCLTALFCTLRVSELLGLQWRHVDRERKVLTVRQRYYRGDIDIVKSRKGNRDIAIPPELFSWLESRRANDDDFVFGVRTHVGTARESVCRDDRDINQHFLRPAAKKLGVYTAGFGFHSLRREAITNLQEYLSPLEVMRMSGHAKVDMSLHYTLTDSQRQADAVGAMERRFIQ